MPTLRLLSQSGPPLEFTRDRTLVGRDPSCEVVLEDRSVSRRHAIVERRGAVWYVVDQGSANGTFVDGQQIVEAELRDRQELRLGTYPLWVEIESEAGQTVMMDPAAAMSMMPPPPPAGPAGRGASAAPAPAARGGAAAVATPRYGPEEEAASLLGVTVGAPPQEVRLRYEEVSGDLAAKLASARTPNLQATYQRNLDETRRAAELLAPGSTSPASAPSAAPGPVALEDLPSSQPSVADEMDDSLLEPPKPLARESPPPTDTGPAPITTTLGALIVLMLGTCAFFAMSKSKTAKASAALGKSQEMTAARSDWLKYQAIDQLEKDGTLSNGRLKICNKGSQPLEIAWLGAVTVNVPKDPAAAAQGHQVTYYNSQFCPQDFKPFTVPPGAEHEVTIASENDRCRWNGEGIFFAFAARLPQPAAAAAGAAAAAAASPAPPSQPVWVSGLLNNRKDCVTIGETL